MQLSRMPLFFLLLMVPGTVLSQQIDYIFSVPQSTDPTAPFVASQDGIGTRSVAGPFDLDNDGWYEILITDYTGGGRVHVIENKGKDKWALVYSTPWLTNGINSSLRYAYGGDLDNDGYGEIMFFSPTSDPAGFVVYEHTGANDDYGSVPASIYPFDAPDRFRIEQFTVEDIDNDGRSEVMMPNNGINNVFDKWYVFSVEGDIGSGIESWKMEVELSSRAIDLDPVYRGGGSPYGIIPADLNGDGKMDLSMHSWNLYNFTNGTVAGADTYNFPEEGSPNLFYQASMNDEVAFFPGVVSDVDGDGNDEIFFMRLGAGGALSILNYESWEDVLQVTGDNLILDIASDATHFGFTKGDINGDGIDEIIGTGSSYTADEFMAGKPADYLHATFFNGGDPELASSYSVVPFNVFSSIDRRLFNQVQSDSLGHKTITYENPSFGPPFAVKVAYLGDVDRDEDIELALAYQGIADSVTVTRRIWNSKTEAWDETALTKPITKRPFVRIVSFNSNEMQAAAFRKRESSAIKAHDVSLPEGYILEGAYPNPLHTSTTIGFTTPETSAVKVTVYDIQGREVRTLIDKVVPAGTHEVQFDAGNLPGGMYLYRLETPAGELVRRVVVLR